MLERLRETWLPRLLFVLTTAAALGLLLAVLLAPSLAGGSRSKADGLELLELFDAASPTDCYERSSSIRPQQALALSNSDLAREMSRKLAGRLTLIAPEDGDISITAAALDGSVARGPLAATRAAQWLVVWH